MKEMEKEKRRGRGGVGVRVREVGGRLWCELGGGREHVVRF